MKSKPVAGGVRLLILARVDADGQEIFVRRGINSEGPFDQRLPKMLLNSRSTSVAEIDGGKLGFAMIAFIVVNLACKFLLLLHVLCRGEYEVNDSVHLRELLRHKNAPDLVHDLRVFE